MGIVIKFKICDMTVCLVLEDPSGKSSHGHMSTGTTLQTREIEALTKAQGLHTPKLTMKQRQEKLLM